MILLHETKIAQGRALTKAQRLGFDKTLCIPSSGGMWILWNKNQYDVDIVSQEI